MYTARDLTLGQVNVALPFLTGDRRQETQSWSMTTLDMEDLHNYAGAGRVSVLVLLLFNMVNTMFYPTTNSNTQLTSTILIAHMLDSAMYEFQTGRIYTTTFNNTHSRLLGCSCCFYGLWVLCMYSGISQIDHASS